MSDSTNAAKQPSKFRNPDTRIRIHPDTYIKFDGSKSITMQNIRSQQGVQILYDILLIVYELVEWKTIGELIAPWPADDQEKIMDHLEMLNQAHIVVDDESEEFEDISESGLSEHLGHSIHINVENHHAMLRDYVRMSAYRRAIERAVNGDTVAVDLGAGSGVLSFFAVEAGAQKVYAIERRPDMVMLSKEMAKANGYDEQITYIEKSSSLVKEDELVPKPNLLIAEILGNGILEENILEFTLDARDRFLTAGGRMIPSGLQIYFFGYDSGLNQDKMLEVNEFKDLYGIDFDLMGQVLVNKTITRTERYSTVGNKTMSEPVCAKTLDFTTLDSTVFVEPFEIIANEDGSMTGFCGYFKAPLDAETILTNSPWAPSTHWTQITYTLPKPIKVKKGDAVKLELVYDGAMRLNVLEE